MSELSPEDEAVLDKFKRWKHRPKDNTPGTSGDPTPQEVYADLMKNVFAPALRSAGLKGSAGRFHVPSETHWAQLGFQKSAYSDRSEVRFTVNLSVMRRDTWAAEAATRPYLGKRPSPNVHYSWADQVRIGFLTEAGEDFWWRLVRGDDGQAASQSVVSALLDLAVPWLASRACSA